jgi:Bifunctional DNA primase/polymerase, N-terminal
VPGAFLIGDRYACGPLCPGMSCHPAVHHWEKAASSDLSDVKRWWAEVPFSILLSTGHAVDVIEAPAWLGISAFGHADHAIRSVRKNSQPGPKRILHWGIEETAAAGPIVATPAGQWLFLVRSGQPLQPELASRIDIVLHARGSWISAPPSPTPTGRLRWQVPPAAVRWQLPEAQAVQEHLIAALKRPSPTFATTFATHRRAA